MSVGRFFGFTPKRELSPRQWYELARAHERRQDGPNAQRSTPIADALRAQWAAPK